MNRVFPPTHYVPRKAGGCPYWKRIEKLTGVAREEAAEMWDQWRLACGLACGPDQDRAQHWAWEAVSRQKAMERFLNQRVA